jgi:dynein assembly factor 1
MIAKNNELKYLDERPVSNEEKRLVLAWVKGGKEAEKEERNLMAEEKKKSNKVILLKVGFLR